MAIVTILVITSLSSCYFLFLHKPNSANMEDFNSIEENLVENLIDEENSNFEINNQEQTEKSSYIKWFEFKPTYEVLQKTATLDIDSHTKNEEVQYNWIELISYLACKYGNDFKKFKQTDLDKLVTRLKNGEAMEEITKDMKLYSYYYEGYEAVLSQFIGNYEIQKPISNKSATSSKQQLNTALTNSTSNTINNTSSNQVTTTEVPFTSVYGMKAFHPLAQNYSYSHYDDFGNSRSYGYKRLHFGNDLMGSIGTPVIAVESGIVEAVRLESIWWLENWYS